jgi:hypothetical protein
LAATVGATSLLTACGVDNPFGNRVCTAIGCSDGILVAFDEPPPNGTIIEVRDVKGEVRTIECGVDRYCEYGAFFEGFTPLRATVRVVTPTGETSGVFDPVYEPRQPNGPDCEPTCLQARVVAELPPEHGTGLRI